MTKLTKKKTGNLELIDVRILVKKLAGLIEYSELGWKKNCPVVLTREELEHLVKTECLKN